MSFAYFFEPNSILLISDDSEFEKEFLSTYKGKILTPEKGLKSKSDLMILNVESTKITNYLRKYGRMSRSILIRGKIRKKDMKKIALWSKRNKIPVLNGDIFLPYLFSTIKCDFILKRGSVFVVTDSPQTSRFWLDYFSYERIGIFSLFRIDSSLNLEELLKYLSKNKEISLLLFDIEKGEYRKELSTMKVRKKAIFMGGNVNSLDEVKCFVYSTLLPPSEKKSVLFITNGYRYVGDLPLSQISSKLQKKVQKFTKRKISTNLIDVGTAATSETIKKVIEIAKSEIGIFVTILNPYVEELNEGIVYALAVLRENGIPIVAYVPGGRKSKELRDRLLEFSIPSFGELGCLKRFLNFLGTDKV